MVLLLHFPPVDLNQSMIQLFQIFCILSSLAVYALQTFSHPQAHLSIKNAKRSTGK